jgi:xylulokinase
VSFILGIDVSTTVSKAALIDESGAIRGVGTSEYAFDVPRPLWSEQERHAVYRELYPALAPSFRRM